MGGGGGVCSGIRGEPPKAVSLASGHFPLVEVPLARRWRHTLPDHRSESALMGKANLPQLGARQRALAFLRAIIMFRMFNRDMKYLGHLPIAGLIKPLRKTEKNKWT